MVTIKDLEKAVDNDPVLKAALCKHYKSTYWLRDDEERLQERFNQRMEQPRCRAAILDSFLPVYEKQLQNSRILLATSLAAGILGLGLLAYSIGADGFKKYFAATTGTAAVITSMGTLALEKRYTDVE